MTAATEPPKVPPTAPEPNFGVQAAKASWVAPIIVVVLSQLSSVVQGPSPSRTVAFVVGITSLALYILGLVFGILALKKIPQYGREGIFKPAIVGIALNGFFILAGVAGAIIAIKLYK